MSSQLKPSPLEIKLHEFTNLQLTASATDSPAGPHKLTTRRSLQQNPDDPLDHKVVLTVSISAEDEENPCPYTAEITVVGYFKIAAAYPEEKRQTLIEVTAASILYGSCREMLVNMTARSSHGILSLPSISFTPSSDK